MTAIQTTAPHMTALRDTSIPALAPWNRPGAFEPRPRHLRLVTEAEPARRTEPTDRPAPSRRLRGLALGLGLAVLVALASLGILAFLGADAAASTPASSTGATAVVVAEPSAPRWVVVQSGDSLWTVARRLQPSGDVRALVDRLAARVGASIVVGQRIDVTGLVD